MLRCKETEAGPSLSIAGAVVALGGRARMAGASSATAILLWVGCNTRGSSPRRLASLIDLPGLRARLLLGSLWPPAHGGAADSGIVSPIRARTGACCGAKEHPAAH